MSLRPRSAFGRERPIDRGWLRGSLWDTGDAEGVRTVARTLACKLDIKIGAGDPEVTSGLNGLKTFPEPSLPVGVRPCCWDRGLPALLQRIVPRTVLPERRDAHLVGACQIVSSPVIVKGFARLGAGVHRHLG